MKKSGRIPKALTERIQWVAYQQVIREDGKATKIPYDPKNSRMAKTNDPKTWGTFKQAVNSLIIYNRDGLGFVLTRNDNIVGFDLDHCVNSKTGKIEDWAIKIIDSINSYTEYSPSNEGIRIFALGTLPQAGRKSGNFEMYRSGRYLSVTGNHLSNTPLTLENRQEEIDHVFDKYFSQDEPNPYNSNPRRSDTKGDLRDKLGTQAYTGSISPEKFDFIMEKALKAKNGEKFRALMEGKSDGYISNSERDLSFCKMLAFWHANNHSAIDKAFRESKCYRTKWDEKRGNKTYGQITIEKAIKTTKKVYTPTKELLMSLVNGLELFHDPQKQPCVTYPKDNHYETTGIYSNSFLNWLNHEHYKTSGKLPKQTEVDKVLDILEAGALFESPEKQLHARLAKHKGKIYIDLCNEEWEVVEISKKGWKIINTEKCPVKFKRTHGMRELPRPKRKGNLKHLKKIVNLPDGSAFILIVAWLVGALNPEGPYPMLYITGQHGTSKSTLERTLRNLIDPSIAPLKPFPKTEQDMILSANNSLILAYDNISKINWWQSDAMCRLATGGGFATRKLYEDDVEIVFSACRPIMFNGIDPVMSGHDLIDRCIVIELLPISVKKKKTEREIAKEFKKRHRKLFGALCDAVSEALKNYKSTKLKRLPRMADFTTWVVAAEPVLPWKRGRFIKTYRRNINEAVQKSLGADEIAVAITKLVASKKHWKGTATELLRELEAHVLQKTLKSRMWPKVASQLSRRVKLAAPFLKSQGVEITFDRKQNRRLIQIRKIKKS